MIKQTYIIKAPIEDVWKALVDPKLIEQWSGAQAEMDLSVGGTFQLWNGDIWGTNTFIDAPKHLEQDWFGDKWDKPSKVCFAMVSDDGQTTLVLCHGEIPEREKDFADGWRDYYFEPLKKLVEA